MPLGLHAPPAGGMADARGAAHDRGNLDLESHLVNELAAVDALGVIPDADLGLLMMDDELLQQAPGLVPPL